MWKMGFFALLMTGRPMQAQNPGSKQGVGLARPAVVAEQGRVSSSRLADHYSVVPQSQAVKGMYLGPVRRRLDADDDFFEAGNVQRALLCKLSVFRQEEEEEEDGTAMMAAFEDDQPRHECMFQGCGAYFSSLKRHEAHYETSHRNLCSTCGCSFPTHRLLDLHLSELHDSFFKAMAERRPMYVCLVEGCPDVFESSKKRHAHLVGVHRYPKSFDFSRPPLGGKKRSRVRRMEGVGADGAATKSGLDNAQRKPRRRRGRPKYENNKPTLSEASGATASSGVEETESMSDGDPHGGVGPRSATGALNCERQESLVLAPGLGSMISAAPRGNPGRPTQDGDMDLEVDVGSGTEGAMVEVRATDLPGKGGKNAPRQNPKACKFWRTATGCRAEGECRFRHDAEDAVGRDLPVSGVEKVKGWGVVASEPSPSGGSWSRKGHVAGVEDVSGVDELVAEMQKMLVPNHLRFGSSARRGKPMGSMRR